VFEPTGRYAYTNATDILSEQDIVSAQKVDSTTGALSSNGPAVATGNCGCDPSSIAVDPSGRFLFQASYVLLLNGRQPQISQLKINQDGTLTPNGVIAVAGQVYPSAITLVSR
jgi:6-phosphogluconolactonase (cycloisomerase 2 family)